MEIGSPFGTLQVNGAYNQTSTGSLLMEIGGYTTGTQRDLMNVQAIATLAGTFNLDVVNGFKPQLGDQIVLMTWSNYVGQFDTIIVSNLNGYQYEIKYEASRLVLKINSAPPQMSDPLTTRTNWMQYY